MRLKFCGTTINIFYLFFLMSLTFWSEALAVNVQFNEFLFPISAPPAISRPTLSSSSRSSQRIISNQFIPIIYNQGHPLSSTQENPLQIERLEKNKILIKNHTHSQEFEIDETDRTFGEQVLFLVDQKSQLLFILQKKSIVVVDLRELKKTKEITVNPIRLKITPVYTHSQPGTSLLVFASEHALNVLNIQDSTLREIPHNENTEILSIKVIPATVTHSAHIEAVFTDGLVKTYHIETLELVSEQRRVDWTLKHTSPALTSYEFKTDEDDILLEIKKSDSTQNFFMELTARPKQAHPYLNRVSSLFLERSPPNKLVIPIPQGPLLFTPEITTDFNQNPVLVFSTQSALYVIRTSDFTLTSIIPIQKLSLNQKLEFTFIDQIGVLVFRNFEGELYMIQKGVLENSVHSLEIDYQMKQKVRLFEIENYPNDRRELMVHFLGEKMVFLDINALVVTPLNL